VSGFTGLATPLEELRTSRKLMSGPYPADWLRHQFQVDLSRMSDIARLDRWIEKTMTGRWGSYYVATPECVEVVVLFELAGDLFRFRNGAEHDFLKPMDEW
jgi:hypothetical protein